MMDPRLKHILDASVIIDLHAGGVLIVFGQVFADLVVPDLVLAELKEPSAHMVIQAGVSEVFLSGKEVDRLLDLAVLYPRADHPDLACLVVAEGTGGMVLSNDSGLRVAVMDAGHEVHGVLWVLDQLVSRNSIVANVAAKSLRLMIDAGAWLPNREVKKRLRKWRF